jgi:hypothetical protein
MMILVSIHSVYVPILLFTVHNRGTHLGGIHPAIGGSVPGI